MEAGEAGDERGGGGGGQVLGILLEIGWREGLVPQGWTLIKQREDVTDRPSRRGRGGW